VSYNSSDMQRERELIKQEILNELRKERLKKELVDEIQKRSKAGSLTSFIQHPGILLLLSFALTGIVGTLLTTRWQRNEWNRQQALQTIEWNRQQSRLTQIRNIDHKYEVIDEITRAVGESNAAATEILFTFSSKAQNLQASKGRERMMLWQQAQQHWQKSVSVIHQKVTVFFRNSQLLDHLIKIVDKADLVFFNLLELVDRATENQREIENEEFKRIALSTKHLINSRSTDLRNLVFMMMTEIEDDIRPR
jgi:hypothetical protein